MVVGGTMELEQLDNNLIFLDQDYASRNEMFAHVSQILLQHDYVTDQYLEKVIHREEHHPTGFKLRKINVAMPHVDPEYVKKNGMFVVTSKKGIIFNNAETDDDLPVNIVFGLLLKESDTHLTFLMKLASSFQNDALLLQLLNSNNKLEIKNMLNSILV